MNNYYQKIVIGRKKAKDKLITPVIQPLINIRIKPNWLTAIGLIFGLLSAIILYVNFWLFLTFAVINFLLDNLDGALARQSKQTSAFGKYFDYGSDCLVTLVLLLNFYLHNQSFWILSAIILYIILMLKVIITRSNLYIAPTRTGMFITAILKLEIIGGLIWSLYYLGTISYLIYLKLLKIKMDHNHA